VKRSLVALIILALSCVSGVYAQQPSSQAVVPSLIKFGGHLVDSSGNPYSTTAGVTFALYKDQQGGAPLWIETQNIKPDATGHYTVFLGSMTAGGLPSELFSEGEARWLGVQVAGESEQPRVLLVAVPYAMKAADAETLGGKPASAFMLAPGVSASGSSSSAVTNNAAAANIAPALSGGGTQNYVPLWLSSTKLGNSKLFQTGGKVGFGTTTPATLLDVNGMADIRNTLTLFPNGSASALLVSGTGFSITNQGLINFASGQTFPGGGGTVTSVGTGAGLTGGPITSSGTISVANSGITNAMLVNPSITINTGTGSGLSGGGSVALGGSLTLGVDPTQVALLNRNNTFTGSIVATAFAGDGSALVNVSAATAATATNALNLGGFPASYYAPGTGTQQGVLAEWTGTTPPYTVGNSPVTDSGGSLTSTEPISAPSINTTGSGAGVVTIGNGTTNVTWTLGAVQPSGSCSPGSLYSFTNGGAGTTLWVCEGPSPGTWVAK
jgi:hypothetical protein